MYENFRVSNIIVFMKLFVLSSLLTLFLFFTSANAQQIRWFIDFPEANKIAVESGKPLLLDFTAVWCKPCREMEKDFWTRSDVVEVAQNFVCVKVDLIENPKLADKYGVESLPNIILTDSWGNGLDFHRGFGRRSADEIIGKLKNIPTDFGEIKAAQQQISSNKNNLEALAKIAEFYQTRKFYYLSSDFYKRMLKVEKNALKREALMLNLAANYREIGWNEEAKTILEKFKKEFPNSARMDDVNRELSGL